MLTTLQIEGFQSHDSTEIELSKGVNVIVGSSDSGKSSIIRACKWLFQNRPQGDAFRNNLLEDKDECSVCAIFEDDSYVLRQKMKGTNSYLVDDIEFKALRSDVPQKVYDTTRIKEVNLQSQHPMDQYFLLTDSPGQVAKKFNEVAGLAIMDKAMFKINSFVRECKSKSKMFDTEISEKKIELKTLNWVPKAQKEAGALADFSLEINTFDKKIDGICDIFHDIDEADKKLKEFKSLDGAISAYGKLKSVSIEHNNKYIAVKAIKNFILDIKNLDKHIKTYESISFASTAILSIISLDKKRKKLEDQNTKLRQLVLSLRLLSKDITKLDVKISEDEKEFAGLLKTNRCPVCGRK